MAAPAQFAKNNWLIDILLLSSVFLVFYCLWLGSYPLFTPDEGRYSAIAREMIFAHDYITPRLNGIPFLDKPILYYWLQAAAMKIFGVNEWALRFFPMLSGVVSCIALYICARQCFNRRTGILAALILASSPLYFCGAHYANLDLEVAAFIGMTLLFFITGVQKQNRWLLFAAYLCSALAFLTKGLIGIAFPAMIAGSWIILTGRWAVLKRAWLPQGILLFLLVVTPWYILAQRANPDFFHFFFVTQQVTRFLSAADFNNQNAFWFYIPVIFVGFFPWSVLLPQALYMGFKNRRQNDVLLFTLLWFVIIFAFFSIPRSKTVGYILSAIPPLALLTAYYLDQVWEKARPRLSVIAFMLLSIMLAIALIVIAVRHPFDLSQNITSYLYACAAILFLGATAGFFCLRQARFFSVCLTMNMLFLLTITMSAEYLNQTTAKPLLASLARVRKPQDEIINYYKFYQDIPVYLGERVTLVADWDSPNIPNRDNWVRELWFGMAMQKDHSSLINEKTFLQRWNGDKRVFVFFNENYLHQFKVRAKNYYLIDRYNDIFLVSNNVPR